ncbi:MAG: hypothetical protein BGO14_05615 [Chlamydiales bacterium 38-26]|nr:hypothetical protein [Chlamydiales bacterium]OJV08377.1 MAG: hypothetical protein BGO14_05615 [Chlamydiales bacterium 38-26]
MYSIQTGLIPPPSQPLRPAQDRLHWKILACIPLIGKIFNDIILTSLNRDISSLDPSDYAGGIALLNLKKEYCKISIYQDVLIATSLLSCAIVTATLALATFELIGPCVFIAAILATMSYKIFRKVHLIKNIEQEIQEATLAKQCPYTEWD